jgi:hypothetical protein
MRGVALAAAAGVALCAPAQAQAAEWSRPVAVSSDRRVRAVAAGADARGRLVVVWQHDTGRVQRPPDGGFGGTESSVRARVLAPDGARGRIRTLSITGDLTAGLAVAVNRRGDAVAVWTQAYDGRRYTILAASRRRGGRFGRPQSLGRSDRFVGAAPHVALNDRGDAVVEWARARAVQLASRRGGGRFGRPQTLSSRRSVPAGVVIAADGSAVAAWTAGGAVHLTERRPGQRFGRSRQLNAAGAGAAGTTLAQGVDGTFAVAWRTADSTVAAVREPGGSLGPPQTLATFEPSGSFSGPAAAVTAAGETLVSWVQTAVGPPIFHNEVVAASRPRGGSFGPGAVLSSPGLNADRSALAAERGGTVAASWSESGPRGPSARSRTVAAVRPSGSVVFGLPERLSGAVQSFGPAAIAPSDATTAIVWRGGDDEPAFVVRRGKPPAAPRVSVAPSAAPAGGTVTVRGVRWTPGATVTLLIGPPRSEADPVARVRARADGTFRRRLRLARRLRPGPYVLLGCRRSCRIKASARFRIRS